MTKENYRIIVLYYCIVTTSINRAVRFVSVSRRCHQLLAVSRLSTEAGKDSRMAQPDYPWPDFIGVEIATRCLSHLTSEHVTFFLSAIQSDIRGSLNGYPPVIRIISLYLWYQIEFVITFDGFRITFMSITRLSHYLKVNYSFKLVF